MADKSIGRRDREIIDLLLKHGIISKEQLDQARKETKHSGLRIDVALKKLGLVGEEDIEKVRAAELGVPYMDLTDYTIDPETIKLISKDIVKKFQAVPLFRIQNSLTVGMANPLNIEAIDQIRSVTGMEMIEPVLVSEKGIQRVLSSYYGDRDALAMMVSSIDGSNGERNETADMASMAEQAPVIEMVDLIVSQAVADRASDIHIEPEENCLRIRSRIDGILHEVNVLPKKLQSPVTSRIKVLSQMDIAETRKPQDGRFRTNVDGKKIDLRVSTFPTIHGENVVMRLLDRSSVQLGFKDIGLSEQDFEKFSDMICRPNGIVLVTGPTGSGKTSSLYSALNSITSIEKNIITIEDPVEYELPLIRQTQVNPKAEITFANGLRNILRQDPDIIMVGEIRDKETADVAIQAALTGHLVFSTLHTNDAASTLTRLIDMHVEPFLVASSVVGIVAQRLVRVICDKCKEEYEPPAEVLKEFGFEKGVKFFRGRGCKKCKDAGFVGRTGIFEVMVVDAGIQTMIEERKPAAELKRAALESGMRSLRDDGLAKVREGITTLEEVLRVTTETR